MGNKPVPHQAALAKDFAPIIPADAFICLACSYSQDGLPLTPVPYPCSTPNQPDLRPVWLAAAVTRRRIELRLSKKRLAFLSDLTSDTITRIESGQHSNLMASTIDALERGLRWRRGSVSAILTGGTPHEMPTVPQDVPSEVYVVLHAGLPADVEDALLVHMQSRREALQATLDTEARLLVDQIWAVLPDPAVEEPPNV